MYAIALDVGESTGIVAAVLERDHMPVILASTTIKTERITTSIRQADDFVAGISLPSFKTPFMDLVIVELPFVTKMSDQRKKMETFRTYWMSWVNSVFGKESIPIAQIAPSQWKPTPSHRIDVFQSQTQNRWLLYNPTRHELDAACMLHWYTVWKLGKL